MTTVLFFLGMIIGAPLGAIAGDLAFDWWNRRRDRRSRLNLDSVNRNFRR